MHLKISGGGLLPTFRKKKIGIGLTKKEKSIGLSHT